MPNRYAELVVVNDSTLEWAESAVKAIAALAALTTRPQSQLGGQDNIGSEIIAFRAAAASLPCCHVCLQLPPGGSASTVPGKSPLKPRIIHINPGFVAGLCTSTRATRGSTETRSGSGAPVHPSSLGGVR